MKRPTVPNIWNPARPQGLPDICTGVVESAQLGANTARIRLNNLSGTVIGGAVVPSGVTLQDRDRVLVIKPADYPNWIVVTRILDTKECGLQLGETTGANELHPPNNFTVEGTYGAVFATWDAWTGNTVCWEVEHNSSASATGASTQYTRGSIFVYPTLSEVTRYVRVRAVRYVTETNMAFYSRWTDWDHATSSFDGTFISLDDTPASYAGQAFRVPRVNAAQTALEFVAGASAIQVSDIVSDIDFIDLHDTPDSYAGQALKYVRVNAGETALEFAACAGGAGGGGISELSNLYDVEITDPVDGEHLEWDDATGKWINARERFTNLSDTPASYAGQGQKLVAVNAAEDALEFIAQAADCCVSNLSDLDDVAISAPIDGEHLEWDDVTGKWINAKERFTNLSDTPGSYAGQGGKLVAVNAVESALEFIAQSSGCCVSNLSDLDDVQISDIDDSDFLMWDSTLGKWINHVAPDWPNVITVGATACDYTTVQAAVDAASNGDLVLIMPGTYTEDVTIATQNVSLVGLGVERTIIAGTIEVQANEVSLIGLKVYINTAEADTLRSVYWNQGMLGVIRECWLYCRNTDAGGTSYALHAKGEINVRVYRTRMYAGTVSGACVYSSNQAHTYLYHCDLETYSVYDFDVALVSYIHLAFTDYDPTNINVDGTLYYIDADEILAALLSVDGTGSGLDADKLDGVEGADYTTDAELATHAGLDSGVHGAGGDTLATDADIDADIATHAALDTGVHGAGGDVLATDADIATHDADETAHGIEYILPFGSYNLLQAGRTVTSYDAVTLPFDLTVNSFHCTLQVATTNDGSHYWTATLYRRDGTALGSFDTSGISPDTWARLEDTSLSNNALVAATHLALYITWSKTGSPGALRMHNPVAVATK